MALLGRQISELHSEKERGRPSQEVANYFPVPLQVINRQRGTSLASGQHGWNCSAQQLESIHIFQGGRSLTRLPRAEHKSCSASDKPGKVEPCAWTQVQEPRQMTLLPAACGCQWSTRGTKQKPAAPLVHRHPWELLARALFGGECTVGWKTETLSCLRGIWTLELRDSGTGRVAGQQKAVRSHWGKKAELPLN